jgi:hypothetical protein
MSEQSERIRTALLRFEAARSSAEGRQMKPTEPEDAERQLVVVNEQNLAALFLSCAAPPAPNVPDRKLAAGKGG